MTSARPGTRPGPVYWFILTFGTRRWFSWLGPRVVFPVESWLWARFGRSVVEASFPEMLLTTIGHRSGQPRPVPVLYLVQGTAYVVAATNWGRKFYPAWSDNLLAHPEGEIRLAGSTRPVRARLADDNEKRELWPKLLKLYPAYETYRQRSGLEPRVFILVRA